MISAFLSISQHLSLSDSWLGVNEYYYNVHRLKQSSSLGPLYSEAAEGTLVTRPNREQSPAQPW